MKSKLKTKRIVMANNLNSEIVNIDGRFLLDSYSKVVDYILQASNEDEINLSNCIIKPNAKSPQFDIKELYDLVEKMGLSSKIGIEKRKDSEDGFAITKRLSCYNSIFNSGFLNNIVFEKWVGFDKSQVAELHFNNSVFLNGLSFSDVKINEYLVFEHCVIDNIFIHNTIFEGSMLDFTHSKIESVSLISSDFKYDKETIKEFEDRPDLITSDINLAYAKLGNFYMSECNTDLSLSFLFAKIAGKTTIYNCSFEKGIFFEDAKLSGPQLVIENKQLPNLSGERFISFDRADVQSDIVINNMTCKFITASSVIIQKDGRMCIYASTINDLYFPRATIYGELSILHLKNKSKLSLTYAINLGLVNISLDNLSIFDFDTAKILRQAAQKLNNNIEVTALKAIEHKLYLKGNKFNFSFASIADYTLLYLNQLSSQFGTNWISGVLFCIFVSMISIGIINLTLGEYYFCLNVEDWAIFTNDFWRKSFEFLWLPNLQNFSELTANSKCSAVTVACFIAGKSLIAYGIFQTVSAFRKYSK